MTPLDLEELLGYAGMTMEDLSAQDKALLLMTLDDEGSRLQRQMLVGLLGDKHPDVVAIKLPKLPLLSSFRQSSGYTIGSWLAAQKVSGWHSEELKQERQRLLQEARLGLLKRGGIGKA